MDLEVMDMPPSETNLEEPLFETAESRPQDFQTLEDYQVQSKLKDEKNTSEIMLEKHSESHVLNVLENDEIPFGSHEVEVIYSRAMSRVFTDKSEFIKCHDMNYISNNPVQKSKYNKVPLKPHLTQIQDYKSFMESSLTLKIYLLETITNMRAALSFLERKITIIQDPIFGGVNTLRAWLWILEECLTLTARSAKQNERWKKTVTNNLRNLVTNSKHVCQTLDNLEKKFKQLQFDCSKLEKMSKRKFRSNINGAVKMWNMNEKRLLKSEISHPHIEWIKPIEHKPEKCILKVRWSVDGVTVRISKKTSWLKFNSIKLFRDKQILLQCFSQGAYEYLQEIENYLKDTERLMTKHDFSNSKNVCIQVLIRQLVDKLASKSKLVPREQVIMHCATMRNSYCFTIIPPILSELKVRASNNLKLMTDLFERDQEIFEGKGKRVPLDRWSQINLEIQVDSSIEQIFHRNIKEDYFAKTTTNDDVNAPNPENVVADSITIISSAKRGFVDTGTPNPEKETASTSVSYSLNVNNMKTPCESVIGTCFLFPDVRVEYHSALLQIRKTKRYENNHVELCSDEIQNLVHTVDCMEQAIYEADLMIKIGLCHLLFNKADHSSFQMLTERWFKITFMSLNTLNTQLITPELKEKFASLNSKLLLNTEKLEISIGNVMQLMAKYKTDVGDLDEALEIFPNSEIIKQFIKSESNNKNDELHVQPYELNLTELNQTIAEHYDKLVIRFTEFDMEIEQVPSSSKSDFHFSLNKSSGNIQLALLCIPFTCLLRVVNQVMASITLSYNTIKKMISINPILKVILSPSKFRQRTDFHPLENTIIRILSNSISTKMSLFMNNLLRLEKEIGKFSQMVQVVQIQCVGKKLISGIMDESEGEPLMDMLLKFTQEIPQELIIHDYLSKIEYKRLIQKGLEEITTKEISNKLENDLKINAPIPSENNTNTSILTRINPKLFNSDTLYKKFPETFEKWLKEFEDLITIHLKDGLSSLISPKVSKDIGEKKEVTKSVGYIEGLALVLRESVENLISNSAAHLTEERDYQLAKVESKLKEVADTIKQINLKIRGLGGLLKSFNKNISQAYHKLPQDMSFLDLQIEELRRKPTLRNITLEIWKAHNHPTEEVNNKENNELELRWYSSNKNQIRLRSSNNVKEIENEGQQQLSTWVIFSSMSKSSKVKAVIVIIEAMENSLLSLLNSLSPAETDCTRGNYLFKALCSQLCIDEQSSRITPSDAYVYLKQIENSIITSTICFETIARIILDVQALFSLVMNQLKQPPTLKMHSNRKRRFKESIMINVIIDAPDDIDEWLQVYTEEEMNAQGSGDYYDKTLVEIKAPVEVKSSTTFPSKVTFLSVQESEPSENASKISSFTKISIPFKFDISLASEPTRNICNSLKLIRGMIVSVLKRTSDLLIFPSPSLIEKRSEYFIGILTLLVSTIFEIKTYRDAPNAQKQSFINGPKMLENHLKKLGRSSEDLYHNLSKIEKSIESIEISLGEKYFQASESDLLTENEEDEEEVEFTGEISPGDLARYIAVKTSTYLWQVVCGMDDGVLFKNLISNEKHAFLNLAFVKRIEIVTSIISFIEQILKITENNLQTAKKELNTAKTTMKNYAKKLPLWIKKEIVNESNLGAVVNEIRQLKSASSISVLSLEKIITTFEYSIDILNSIVSFLSIKFKLETVLPTTATKNRMMTNYRSAMENQVLELQLRLEDQLQRFPIALEVPLNMSPMDLDTDDF